MDLQLKDRVAFVTGASKGIGAEIVRELAREGARVAFCARPSPALTLLEAELKQNGHTCLALAVDVFDSAAIISSVDRVVSEWGQLDILVNNVGGALRFGGFEELNDDDWTKAYEFNVMSVVRFTRAALPSLRKSTLRRVINISSTSAYQPGAYNPHYAVTKAAIVNLGKHLANILAKEKILVNTVCAGPVHSESWNENVSRVANLRSVPLEEMRKTVEREESAKIPLGSVGAASHISAAVAWLASPVSEWTTGTCVHVDGGKLGSI